MYNKIHRNHSWLMGTATPGEIRHTQTKLLQIDPYNETVWREQFSNSSWYHDVRSKLPADVHEIWSRSALPGNTPTSREFHFNRYFAMSTLYFINQVLKLQPPQVIDLGCGGNLFRGLVPGLVGIDPYHPSADINDFVDEDFVRGHQAQFDAALAINSLHFRGLDQLPNILQDFYSMLAPGHGMGFVTFGLGVMVDHTSDKAWQDLFGKPAADTTASEVMLWADQVLRNLSWDLHVVDQYYFNQLDIGDVILSNPVDGNIRLVVRRSS